LSSSRSWFDTALQPLLRSASARLIGALLIGLAALAWQELNHRSDILALLAAWDAAGLVLLVLSWFNIASADPAHTHKRAAADDPGRNAVYALVLITSAVSLLSATPLVRASKGLDPGESGLFLALSIATVALSWALTHTAFTLRYAHLYYRHDSEGIGGVEFPGCKAPEYLDFAYLAFTVGMCFQVSDATISSSQIRRTVLLHAVLAFVYNTAILAFVLNLAFGRASG
jgi:uncharacterized membrane protein